MGMLQRLRGRLLEWMILILVLLIGVGLAVLSYSTMRSLHTSSNDANRSTSIINYAQDSLSALKDAQASQRNYLITGDGIFLGDYATAIPETRSPLDSLAGSVAGRADSSSDVQLIREAFDARILNLDQAIAARQQGTFQPAQELVRSGQGTDLMVRASTLAQQFADSERERLAHRLSRQETAQRNASILLVGGVLTIFLLAFVGSLRLRRELRQEKALREKEQAFIGMASHELRTPLTALRGYLSMLPKGGSKGAIPLERAEAAADRMQQIVEELLLVSRIDNNQVKLAPRKTDLNTLATQLAKQFQAAAKSKKISLEVEASKSPLTVFADREKLLEAASRIADNAIKFTEQEGTVTVRVRESDGKPTLEVSDTGKGIASQNLQRVQSKFFREETGYVMTAGGMGLGLYIAERLITLQGADLRIDANPRGTRVLIVF